LKIHDYFQNINISIVFILNTFLSVCKTPLNICTVPIANCIYLREQICIYWYWQLDMIKNWKLPLIFFLKTHDFFQNININVMFLLNSFSFYMLNTIKYFHDTRCRFFVLVSVVTNFYVPIWEGWYDNILKTHDYFQNININVVFPWSFFYILFRPNTSQSPLSFMFVSDRSFKFIRF